MSRWLALGSNAPMVAHPNVNMPTIMAWIVLGIFVNAYWITWDFVISPLFGWPMMTTELRKGLNDPVVGPFLFGFLFLGIPGTFWWHMMNWRARI